MLGEGDGRAIANLLRILIHLLALLSTLEGYCCASPTLGDDRLTANLQAATTHQLPSAVNETLVSSFGLVMPVNGSAVSAASSLPTPPASPTPASRSPSPEPVSRPILPRRRSNESVSSPIRLADAGHSEVAGNRSQTDQLHPTADATGHYTPQVMGDWKAPATAQPTTGGEAAERSAGIGKHRAQTAHDTAVRQREPTQSTEQSDERFHASIQPPLQRMTGPRREPPHNAPTLELADDEDDLPQGASLFGVFLIAFLVLAGIFLWILVYNRRLDIDYYNRRTSSTYQCVDKDMFQESAENELFRR